jgi:DNA-binding Lrp family transcriptional regulator
MSVKKTKKISAILKKAPSRYQFEDYTSISRQKFDGLLPQTVPGIIREDIAYYFEYLKNNRSKKSLKDWEKATGCTDSPNSWKATNYRPLFSYLYYDRLTDGFFLPLLLKKLEITQNGGKEITINEFNKLCRLSVIGFRPSIDAIDLKILSELVIDPSLVTQALTERIEHSYATVYKHLQRLKAKMGLRIVTRINWAKLGIQRVFLISSNEELFSEFNEFNQFIDGQSTFLWGDSYFLKYYLLNESRRKKIHAKYNKLPPPGKKEIKIFELVEAPNAGYSFDLYDLNDQKWQFDFATTFLDPKSFTNQTENIDKRILFNDKYTPDKPYELTEMETKILSGLVGSYDITQKDLAESLGIHAPNLSIIKNKLLDDNIIKPQLEVSMFLPLFLILWCTSTNKKIIQILTYLLEKIPYSNISPVVSPSEKGNHQLICFLLLDDVLYYSLVTFLMDLSKQKQLQDFQLGIITDSYFGMSSVEDILSRDD